MTELKLHPLCAMWPQMSEDELDKLATDIKANGLHEPIVKMPDGSTLDGRNREMACSRAGIEPRSVAYDPVVHGDALAFVVSRNLTRRHLTDVERAMIGGEIANMQSGYRSDLSVQTERFTSQTKAAAMMKVSKTAVESATALKNHAAPNVIDMVKTGKSGLQPAARVARMLSKEEQASLTPADITRIHQAKKNESVGKTLRTKKQKAPMRISPPYMALRTPEPGEVLRPPVGAPIQEHRAFSAKYGRTIVHPTKIADLLKDEEMATDFALGISGIVSPRHPTVEQFLASLDRMLAHVVQRGKDNGEQLDFPRKARGILERIERDLDPAIKRLTELRTLLMERKDRGSEDERNDTRERA